MDQIHPKLKSYVLALASHEFGLQGALAEIRNIESGSIVTKHERSYGDRFSISIVYCKTRLTWQVLMCPNNLMEPPDIIMQDDFLAYIDVNVVESEVPSLLNWDPSDPKCLLNVILELLQLYKQFQGDLIARNQDSRFFLEYQILCSQMSDPKTDLEIFVHYKSRISILTHLKIDFSNLPMPMPNQKYLILLFIELNENGKNLVSLITQAELDDVFGCMDLDIPDLSADILLMEYIHLIEKYLQTKVNSVVRRTRQRKMFFSLLYQAFERSILNCDNITFSSISFLLEVDNVCYVVLIEIPLNFPKGRPKFLVSSMKNYGLTAFVNLKNFNYNANWDVKLIFSEVYKYIKRPAFQHYKKEISNFMS